MIWAGAAVVVVVAGVVVVVVAGAAVVTVGGSVTEVAPVVVGRIVVGEVVGGLSIVLERGWGFAEVVETTVVGDLA